MEKMLFKVSFQGWKEREVKSALGKINIMNWLLSRD